MNRREQNMLKHRFMSPSSPEPAYLFFFSITLYSNVVLSEESATLTASTGRPVLDLHASSCLVVRHPWVTSICNTTCGRLQAAIVLARSRRLRLPRSGVRVAHQVELPENDAAFGVQPLQQLGKFYEA